MVGRLSGRMGGAIAALCGACLPVQANPSSETALAARTFVGAYRLVRTHARDVEVTLTGRIHAPNLKTSNWLVFVPKAPDHRWQEVTEQSLRVDPTGVDVKEDTALEDDVSDEGRRLHRLRVRREGPGLTTLHYRYRAKARLFRITLERGAPKGAVARLTANERESCLAAQGPYNFLAAEFKAWLDKAGLVRANDERDLTYAWRVLHHIGEHFEYAYPVPSPGRSATEVIADGRSDCGGLSILVASALRAHGIPARLHVGRWANVDAKKGDPQFHARGEFFAKGVGWVPFDGSGALLWKGGVTAAFGINRGQFFTMHTGTDLIVDAHEWGRQPVRWMQSALFWLRGDGNIRGLQHGELWQARNAVAKEASD